MENLKIKAEVARNEIFAEYRKEYERTNGRPAPELSYENGWVHIAFISRMRMSEFAKCLQTLRDRPTYVLSFVR